jgi:predicted nucleic acid-binding protein
MIVIDASTALAWAFNDDDFADRFADQLASERLLAPPIWRLEVVNVILRNERQRLITLEQGNRILAALNAIDVEIVDSQAAQALEQLAAFARPHQLTAYDAAYLDVALKSSATLLTLDQNLKDAAGRLGVSLMETL